MCYIRHCNKPSSWSHFTRLQSRNYPFSYATRLIDNGLLHAGLPRLRSGTASVYPHCSLALVYTLLYAAPYSLLASFGVWAALSWLRIRSLTLQTFCCCMSCSWSSAILFPWSIQFSLIRLKIIHYCCYIFFERNSLTLSWLRNFYLPVIFIKIRSYSLNPISWITIVSCRL